MIKVIPLFLLFVINIAFSNPGAGSYAVYKKTVYTSGSSTVFEHKDYIKEYTPGYGLKVANIQDGIEDGWIWHSTDSFIDERKDIVRNCRIGQRTIVRVPAGDILACKFTREYKWTTYTYWYAEGPFTREIKMEIYSKSDNMLAVTYELESYKNF